MCKLWIKAFNIRTFLDSRTFIIEFKKMQYLQELLIFVGVVWGIMKMIKFEMWIFAERFFFKNIVYI